jgi:hypothetical protein
MHRRAPDSSMRRRLERTGEHCRGSRVLQSPPSQGGRATDAHCLPQARSKAGRERQLAADVPAEQTKGWLKQETGLRVPSASGVVSTPTPSMYGFHSAVTVDAARLGGQESGDLFPSRYRILCLLIRQRAGLGRGRWRRLCTTSTASTTAATHRLRRLPHSFPTRVRRPPASVALLSCPLQRVD